MPCAGAEGFLVMTEERARALGLPFAASSAPSSGTTRFPTIRSRCAAAGRSIATIFTRRRASAPPTWISSQVYDDYPVINVMQLEDLGFCQKGEGADFVRRNTFTVGGSLPLNTSGGQLSVGQAGAAGGYLGLDRSGAAAHRPGARRAGRERAARPRQRLRHDQLRSRPVHRRRRSGARMTAPLAKAEAAQSGPRAAPADAAAGRAQPRGAAPHRGRGRRALRAAALLRLRHGAVSAALGLP